MEPIEWSDSAKVALRVGRVPSAEPLPRARTPACVLRVDFGPELGVRRSGAQITALYRPEERVAKRVVAVVHVPPKQIGPIVSECLLTGFHDARGRVTPCVPEHEVPLGTKRP